MLPSIRKKASLVLCCALFLFGAMHLAFAIERTHMPRPNPNGIRTGDAQHGRQSSALGGSLFLPSLEMKENVDFLLTPALIVQECLMPDVLPTYPSE